MVQAERAEISIKGSVMLTQLGGCVNNVALQALSSLPKPQKTSHEKLSAIMRINLVTQGDNDFCGCLFCSIPQGVKLSNLIYA
jgi:hypothetical protein